MMYSPKARNMAFCVCRHREANNDPTTTNSGAAIFNADKHLQIIIVSRYRVTVVC